MVIYSLAAGGVSIGTLFLAGYLPGILMGIALMITAYVVSVRRGYPTESLPPWRQSLKIVLGALPSFLVAVIIVGGIVSGIFTTTESAAFGVLAALLVSGLFYRELTGPRFWEAVTQAVRTVSTVIFIIATASAFAWLMAYLRIPAQLSEFILGLSSNPIVLLLLINLMLLLLGMVMDMGPLILIMTPVLFPIVTADPINMNPVHFGIMLMVNLALGLTTPPVGTALFVGCAVGKVKIEEVSRAMIYFWPPMFLVLMIVTFFPSLVLWIPRLLGVPGT
jgi:tripartite ATP-independent transporter DctM subunit